MNKYGKVLCKYLAFVVKFASVAVTVITLIMDVTLFSQILFH